MSKITIISLIVIPLLIIGYFLLKTPSPAPSPSPTPVPAPPPPTPAPPTDQTSGWLTESWQGHTFKYPPTWQKEIFNDKNNQPISFLIRPPGSTGEDRIFIGTFPVGGGQFFAECPDVLAASPNTLCQIPKGLLVVTATQNQAIKNIYNLVVGSVN